jgi:mannose/fructose-specific phosphotransferase system component IIA
MSDEAAPLVRGVLVTHGSMCFGMVDAVRKIAGPPADSLAPLSNESMGPEELLRTVDELAGSGPVIIFTDLQTGSCALAARFACRDPAGRRVVSGTNLPMLLDFVFHRHLPLDPLVDRLLDRGRNAVHSFHLESR